MKTSARNELTGKVKDIKSGEIITEIILEVTDCVSISATITNDAKDSLGLNTGDTVSALVKSSSIILATAELKASARNIIKGTISEIVKGQVNSEVKLTIGDNTICAIVTNEAVEDLGLKVDETAYAIFKAASVILVA